MGERSSSAGVIEPDYTVEQLNAMDAVTQLKARYFRFMDLKRWDDWQALYTPNAVLDASGEAAALADLGIATIAPETLIYRTAAAIRDNVSAALEGVVTVHHGHMGEFRFLTAERIAATWAMQDVIRYPVDAATPIRGFDGFGHYHDVYARHDGRWLIESVKLTRLALLPVHRDPNE